MKNLKSLAKSVVKVAVAVNSSLMCSAFTGHNLVSASSSAYSMAQANKKLKEIDSEITNRSGFDDTKMISMENGYYSIPCVNGLRYTVPVSDARELENVLGTSFNTLIKFRQEYIAASGDKRQNNISVSYYDPMSQANEKLRKIDLEITNRLGFDDTKMISMENGYYSIPCVNGLRYTVPVSDARELENVLGTSFNTLIKFRQEYIAASSGGNQNYTSSSGSTYQYTTSSSYNYNSSDFSAPPPVNNSTHYQYTNSNRKSKKNRRKKNKKHNRNGSSRGSYNSSTSYY